MTVNHKFIIDNELLRHLEKFIFVILVFEPVTFRCLLKLFLPLWGGRWVEVTLLTYGASTLNEPVPSFTKIVSPSRQVLKQVTLLTHLVNVCFCLVPIKVVSSCSFLEIHNRVMAPCNFFDLTPITYQYSARLVQFTSKLPKSYINSNEQSNCSKISIIIFPKFFKQFCLPRWRIVWMRHRLKKCPYL